MAIRGKNMLDLKQGNRSAILLLLHEQGGMSRKQIAAKLNLTPAAITMIVTELIEDGIIREVRVLEGNGSAGRKEILVDLCADRFFSMGVYYGVERVVISVTDLGGRLLGSETFLYDYGSGADFVISKICKTLSVTLRQYEQKGLIYVGLGVSARGIVDDAAGICIDSYGGWGDRNVPIKDQMSELLHSKHISFKQNVRALADAYIFTNHTEVIESMLFVKNDVGIGSALVINHRVHLGYHCNAGEMGHIVVDPQGKPCRCGGRGCLETIASCYNIEKDLQAICTPEKTPYLYTLAEGNVDNVTFRLGLEAVEQDSAVKKILDRAADELAKVIRNAIIMLDVQKLVLHGTVFHSAYFMGRLTASVNFDSRYSNLGHLLAITSQDTDLDMVCSPILAIKDFFGRGGSL